MVVGTMTAGADVLEQQPGLSRSTSLKGFRPDGNAAFRALCNRVYELHALLVS